MSPHASGAAAQSAESGKHHKPGTAALALNVGSALQGYEANIEDRILYPHCNCNSTDLTLYARPWLCIYV
jgi:hypothetical protein